MNHYQYHRQQQHSQQQYSRQQQQQQQQQRQQQQQQRQQQQQQQQHQQQVSIDEPPSRSRRTSMDSKQQAANPPRRRPRTISQEKLLCMRLASLHKEMEAALGRRSVLGVTLDRHDSNLSRVEDDVDQLDAQGRRVRGDIQRLIRRQCSDEARIGDLSREMLEVEIAV